MTDIIFIESTQRNGLRNNHKYILTKRECSDCGDCRRVRFLSQYVCYTCDSLLPKCQTVSQIRYEENARNRKIQKKKMNNYIPVVYSGHNISKR